MIKKHEVKTYIERLYCDRCGVEVDCKIVLHDIGSFTRFIYECPFCGKQVVTSLYYPRKITEEED